MRFLVVTPSFNQLDYLKRCIASVADQVTEDRMYGSGRLDIHHHIQDGGSTDGTVDFLKEYASRQEARNNYQFTFDSEADKGMYDAVGKGWAAFLEGNDIAAWLNCDEQYLEGALGRIADWLAAHQSVDAVFGNALVVRPDGTLLCARKVFLPKRNHIATSYLPVFSAAMFLRAGAVADQGFLPDPEWRVLGDVELILRMIHAHAKMGILNEPLAAFTDSGDNYSLTGPATAEQLWMMQKVSVPVRILKPLWMICHRTKKLFSGAYIRRPVSYALYAGAGTDRTAFFVNRAPVVWRGR